MASQSLVVKIVAQNTDLPPLIAVTVCAFLNPAAKNVMLQNGGATGDVFQVAGALKLHRDFSVVIFGNSGNPRDRSQWIYRYYVQEWGISSGRVVLQWVNSPEKTIAAINSSKLLEPHGFVSGTVGWATNLLHADLQRANQASPANLHCLQTFIKGTHLSHLCTRDKVAGFCLQKGIPEGGQIVVLWSRRSGKTGAFTLTSIRAPQ